MKERFSWQPSEATAWVVLAGMAVPAGFILNSAVRQLAGSQSVYVWMYAHNWTNTYLHAGWLRSELIPTLCGMIVLWLRIGCFRP